MIAYGEIIPVLVPDGASGDWRVESFEVSAAESRFTQLREALGHPDAYVPAGRYKRLTFRGAVVMSNTPFEARAHWDFLQHAKGRVLINGLGLGMALSAILANDGQVTEVTVVEKAIDVIDLVGPTFAHDSRVKILHADAFTFQPMRGARFDAVWHDIWNDLCPDNLDEMRALRRKYARRAAWQGCWSQQEIYTYFR